MCISLGLALTIAGVSAAAAAATTVGTSMIMGAGKEKAPEAAPLPAVPSIMQTSDQAREEANRKRAASTGTILTSPLSQQKEAETKKTILGG